MRREIIDNIKADLEEKMVFVGGPRQVGKTTLGLQLLNGDETHPAYLTWDDRQDQKALFNGELPANQSLLVLDEIHKYKDWRNLIKGFYDKNKSSTKFLITGSARLIYYRRGGDSLQGRYHYHRLHPLSLDELKTSSQSDLEQLIQFGGFPEPFLQANKRHWNRWQRERTKRVIQEDLISLERVRELSTLDLMVGILPERVGSVLSIKNLSADLQVAFETARNWISILENLYFCFCISPYYEGMGKLRLAKKEQKLYLWDWSLVPKDSNRFENLVASRLLKYCHHIEDNEGDSMDLQFVRDATKKEIDFVVMRNAQPVFAVECKTGQQSLSKQIEYYSSRLQIPKYYQVHLGDADKVIPKHNARIIPFGTFCQELDPS